MNAHDQSFLNEISSMKYAIPYNIWIDKTNL